jgi:hypothetical protein
MSDGGKGIKTTRIAIVILGITLELDPGSPSATAGL